MKVKVNGQAVEIRETLTVLELLAHQKVNVPDYVTVQRNGEILDRKAFETTRISEDDEIEFLYFMGGGSLVARAGRWL